MPARCCTLIQIHTVVDDLPQKVANEYREKFEEWVAASKTYCPAPACSAFIPERLMPRDPGTPGKGPSPLLPFLQSLLATVQESACSRFFRGEMDITMLPGYASVVERPIDLSKINANLFRYDSVNSLTGDIQLLVSNAISYNGHDHPVSRAAEELLEQYIRALSLGAQRLLDRPPTATTSSPTFACHKCHIAICTLCTQVEHANAPCDTTASDQELAMLESFGYKRCPRCKAGVKKMFGCSHMACLCGAHFCYWCQRPIDECDGGCSQQQEEDEEEEYYSEEEGEDEAADGEVPTESAPAAPQPAAEANPDAPVNLDGGGAPRWGGGDHDFGDEPEEVPHKQMWACTHDFSHYGVPNDAFNRGDYLKMECNRCFTKVTPRKPRLMRFKALNIANSSSFGKWLRATEKTNEAKGEPAFECSSCRMVTCEACKWKFEEAAAKNLE